ncbi:hypothetical protein Tco_0298594 [Tanacetum coccineum]
MKETNADLTTELARYKNQEKCFEISQEKYDKLERCYQKSVYQEQCLTKKINALHLSSGKQITTLNEEISNLSKQLSTEKSTVSSLLEEKKKLKSDFKIREDELLDKQIHLENKIKELDNILVKTGQSIQTMHMLSPKPDSFYHTEQKMALGYQNPFYLKQAQRKQQSLYNGKVLLEKHDPPVVHDSEETLQLAQESRQKMKQLNKEIKPANYTKINHLSGIFVSQTAKSQEEVRRQTLYRPEGPASGQYKKDRVPSASKSSCNKIKEVIQICLWCVDSGCSKHMTGNLKLLINFVWKFLGTVRFGNDHVAAILGFGDLQWGQYFDLQVYFVEGWAQICSQLSFVIQILKVAFRRITCFVRTLEGVDLLKGKVQQILTIISGNGLDPNLLMARANFYQKEIFVLYEQGTSKRASHPPNRPNSKQRSKDEAPEVIKTFLKRITVLLQITYHHHKERLSVIPRMIVKILGSLVQKGDISFFIGYSANSCAYRVYNRRTNNHGNNECGHLMSFQQGAFDQKQFKNPGFKDDF